MAQTMPQSFLMSIFTLNMGLNNSKNIKSVDQGLTDLYAKAIYLGPFEGTIV